MSQPSLLKSGIFPDLHLMYAPLEDAELFSNFLLKEEIPLVEDPNWPYPWVKMVKLKFNSHGFRSDEFTKSHNGKHIVFSGCSQTFGVGLEIYETWSNILYNKIAASEAISGYFNLGLLMGSMRSILFDFIKYVNEFGKPDAFFINIPNLFRYYTYDQDNKTYAQAMVTDFHLAGNDTAFVKKLKADFFQDYFLLNSFCKLNNILFLSTSWDFEENNFQSINEIVGELSKFSPETFESFIPSIEDDVIKYCEEYNDRKPSNKYYVLSRDNAHAGTAINEYWANILYDKYMEKIK